MIRLSDEDLINELKKRFEENKKNLDELTRLNKILTKVNNRLSEAEAMKSHFISNISNEIINPFTSILALSKTILESSKESWKQVISMVALIHSETFNLDFQFANIFAAAKLEAGEIMPEISKIDVCGLIKDVIDSFKYEAKKKNLKILINSEPVSKIQSGLFFVSDYLKIKLILANLLSNAVKFSFTEGVIELEYKLENGSLILSLQDHGQGISPENHDIIFDRFQKLDSGINSFNRGHGLGLSVIKAFTDLLGGEISLKSLPGKGARFIVILPESQGDIEGITFNGNELLFDEE
ncbi:MAG: HAMP domain-containing histidine kinase [Bacteroidales bacterium]|nr:HAMP domain-containing histidine kinase [Bacteroidales bacterium]